MPVFAGMTTLMCQAEYISDIAVRVAKINSDNLLVLIIKLDMVQHCSCDNLQLQDQRIEKRFFAFHRFEFHFNHLLYRFVSRFD